MRRRGRVRLRLDGGLPGVGPDYGAIRRGGVAFVVIGTALLGAVAYALPEAVHDLTLDTPRVGLFVSCVVLGASLAASGVLMFLVPSRPEMARAAYRATLAMEVVVVAVLVAAAVATRSHYPLFVLFVQVPATVGMALKELRRLM